MHYIHSELQSEYAVLHSELCVDEGERFLLQMLKSGERYVIGACDPRMQKKMLRDVFKNAGLRFEKAVIPLDLRTLTTEQAIEKIRQAFARAPVD